MSDLKVPSQTRTRKKVKVQCVKCDQQFDDDYRTKHERIYHQGKRTQIQSVGAVSNPFEAAARNKKQKVDENDESLSVPAQLEVVAVDCPPASASEPMN